MENKKTVEIVKEKTGKQNIHNLQRTFDIEYLIHSCLERNADLVHNGRVRKKLLEFAKGAKEAEEVLKKCLNKRYVEHFPKEDCKSCVIHAESFSLLGLVNLEIELLTLLVRLYTALAKTMPEKDMFKKFLKERREALLFFKKEKKFIEKNEQEDFSTFKNNCRGFKVIFKL